MNAKADGLDMARASRYGFQVRKKVLLEQVVVSLSLNVGSLRERCNFDVFLQALYDVQESICCFTMFDDVATTKKIRKPIHWAVSNPWYTKDVFFSISRLNHKKSSFWLSQNPQVVTAVAPLPHAFETVVLSSYEGNRWAFCCLEKTPSNWWSVWLQKSLWTQ